MVISNLHFMFSVEVNAERTSFMGFNRLISLHVLDRNLVTQNNARISRYPYQITYPLHIHALYTSFTLCHLVYIYVRLPQGKNTWQSIKTI